MKALLLLEIKRRWKSPGAWLFLLLQSLAALAALIVYPLAGNNVGIEPVFRWSLRALILSCPLLAWGGYSLDLRSDAWKRMLSLRLSPFAVAFARLLAAWSVCLAGAAAVLAGPAALCALSGACFPLALSGAAAVLAGSLLFSGFCLWVESHTRRAFVAALISAACLGLLFLVSRLGAEPGSLLRIAVEYTPFRRLDALIVGVFSPSRALVMAAGGCAFACLTAARLMLRRSRRPIKPLAAVCAALALAVAAHFALPRALAPADSLDATSARLITPVDQAQEILDEALSGGDDIYAVFVSSGSDPWLENLLNRYHALNARFHVSKVGPASLKYAYNRQALDYLYSIGDKDGYILMTQGSRYTVITSDQLYAYSYAYNYSTGNYVPVDVSFAAQAQLLSAVRFLSDRDVPSMLALEGHYESELGDYARRSLYENGVFLDTDMLREGYEITADCVLIYAPQADISAEERDMLIEYLKNGGSLILATNYQYGDFPNLFAVMDYCGMAPRGVIAIETEDGQYLDGYPYYPAPTAADHESTGYTAGTQIVVPTPHGIQESAAARKGLVRTAILSTSGSSYLKLSPTAATVDREEGDESGPVVLCMTAEDDACRAVWVSGSDYIADATVSVSPANLYLWLSQVRWLCRGELTSHTVDVESPSLAAAGASLSDGARLIPGAAALAPALAALIVCAALLARRRKSFA